MDAGDQTFNFAAVKADGTVGTDPTTTTLDTAYGAASNHFAVYGQEVASASNISEGGSANEVQHLVLDGSTAIAMGDTFSITIDGKVYTTDALAGNDVDALVTALNAAKDSDGTTLTGVTIAKDGSNIKLTWADTTDHQNGTTLFKSGEYSGEATGTDIGTTSHNTVIGGEGNGGVIYPELHYGRDALVGVALFLTHLARTGLTMTQLRKTYPAYYASKNKIQLTPAIDVDKVLLEMKSRYAHENVNDTDGVKIDFPTCWVHLRKSNTEPIIRVYTEARSMAEAEALAQRFMDEIRSIGQA